ncbi:MAG: Trk system potassium transporter TrkA, partial [Anaerovoracaceae bacterium]|nr:Trk system potassium transporter TrkA [Anaerovoracaceae bacterium]
NIPLVRVYFSTRYKYLVEKYTLTNGIFSSGKVALVQFKVKKMRKLAGLSMVDARKILPNMLIVAISREGKIIIPHGQTTIDYDDTLYLIGEKSEITELHKKVHEKGKYTNLQKVMIIGGGKTGFYLADKLSEFGIAVKVIEKDKDRCYYLSTHLDDVMILHGDATDTNLLEEENIGEMDAFVTATGLDEENLLLALMAKQRGIEDVISKVSRQSYKDLIEKMGVDMALNPLDIIASIILRYVQGSKRIVSSLLIQGQAEIIEVAAAEGMKLTGTPLSDLDLPDGVLIAAIHRGNSVIIPDGNTIIEEDDKVTMFCLLTDIAELESLFRYRKGFHFSTNSF